MIRKSEDGDRRNHRFRGKPKGKVGRILDSGAFSKAIYEKNTGAKFKDTLVAIEHYLSLPKTQRTSPNSYFDHQFYSENYPDVTNARVDPFLHYIEFGETEGRMASPFISVVHIMRQLTDEMKESTSTILGVFTVLAEGGVFLDPNPLFQTAFYVSQIENTPPNSLHPLIHYCTVGEEAGLSPSARFNTKDYANRYLNGLCKGALRHYFLVGRSLGADSLPKSDKKSTVFEQIRYFTSPGSRYEATQMDNGGKKPQVKAIAYYLPQFHRDPINDKAWGPGYTEWTALGRAAPRFPGHYQPKIPIELGYYDLTTPGVFERQADMARMAGISAFSFYYYSLGGKKPLSTPLEKFLKTPEIDIEFCLMWANESWSRTWDGLENETVLLQEYTPELIGDLAVDVARYMRDPRYLRVGGRPVFILYKPMEIPEANDMIEGLRQLLETELGEEILLIGGLTSRIVHLDKTPIDGLIEFPPHETLNYIRRIKPNGMALFDDTFYGEVYRYEDAVNLSVSREPGDLPLIKTAVPAWDNEPRRNGWGTVLHGSSPEKFEQWLSSLVKNAKQNPFFGEPLVCINAWNEWAEGAALEPDMHYGYAYLNATARALFGLNE